MCLHFKITCSKYQHSSVRLKESNGSFHICFPSPLIPREVLFVRHTTELLCCDCLHFAKGHSSFIPLPTHAHICGGEANVLSCCFSTFAILQGDLVLLRIRSLCARSVAPLSLGGGWHQLALDGSNSNHGSVSVGAPAQQSTLLEEVTIYRLSFYYHFSFRFFPLIPFTLKPVCTLSLHKYHFALRW